MAVITPYASFKITTPDNTFFMKFAGASEARQWIFANLDTRKDISLDVWDKELKKYN